MGVLDTITTPEDGPVIITIFGEAGLGKTSLASTFPNPIFIRAEDGLKSVKLANRPKAFPVLTKTDELWNQLNALLREDHDFKTVVIDTVTALEAMFIDSVIQNDPSPKKISNIQQALGGYGAGRDAVASMHFRLRKAAGFLMNKGMNVVFLGHAEVNRLEPPDQDAYSRYTLRLHDKSMQPYVDNVDMVGFLRLETFVMGKEGERKKAKSSEDRLLVCYPMASNVSKNRFGITEDIPVVEGVNPLSDIVPSLHTGSKEDKTAVKKTAPKSKQKAEEPVEEKKDEV